MKSLIAVINWFGPYTAEEAIKAAEFDYDDGLYAILGRQHYERGVKLQYIGLAKSLMSRLGGYHFRLDQVTKDQELWLGEIASPRTPGRKIKVTDRMLDLAEWAHIFYLQLPLNEKKKSRPPDRPITVLNRWWKTDYETPLRQPPIASWPNLIDYYAEGYETRVVWFGKRQEFREP